MENLIKNQPLAAFVNARDTIKTKVQQIAGLAKEISALAESILQTSLSYELEKNNYDWDRCRQSVDYHFWEQLLRRGMITNVMTDVARNKYLDELHNNAPEFTQQAVFELAQNIEHIYKDNARQMVMEVYKKLIGCKYGDYRNKKIDNLNGIKQTFRCSGNIRYDLWFKGFRYDDFTRYGINFGDLLRVCYLLDGRNMGNYAERFSVFADEQLKNSQDIIETDYFIIKCFQNGNQLIKWKPEKDYIRICLNQIGGGNGLPDTMSKRYKPEHFENSR